MNKVSQLFKKHITFLEYEIKRSNFVLKLKCFKNILLITPKK